MDYVDELPHDHVLTRDEELFIQQRAELQLVVMLVEQQRKDFVQCLELALLELEQLQQPAELVETMLTELELIE